MEIAMSLQAVTGVVDKTWTKQKATRFGDKELHYVQVDGVTFSTGFKKVFTEGQMITAAVKFNYGELQYQPDTDASGLPAAKGGAPRTNSTGPSTIKQGNFQAKGGSNRGAFPIDPKDGQMSIIRQSSINRAVEIVTGLINAKLFTPKTEDEYLHKVLEVALIVTDFSSGNDIMQLAAAKAAAKEAING